MIFPIFVDGEVEYIVARHIDSEKKPKYLNLKGEINCVFNEDILKHTKEVVICEGIIDTLSIIQHGFPALGVLGTGLFKPEFVDKFKQIKTVYMCFDNDLPGLRGMERLDEYFDTDIKAIPLPSNIKDLNDYFLSATEADFKEAMKRAQWFADYKVTRSIPCEIHIMDVEYASNWRKSVQTEFVAIGAGKTYLIPKRFIVSYKPKKSSIIQTKRFVIPLNDEILIKMCRITDDAQKKSLGRYAVDYIGEKITVVDVEVLECISISELVVLPKVKELKMGSSGSIITEQGKAYRQKVCYLQGVQDTDANHFNAKGYVLADPKTSEALLLSHEFEVIKENFDNFKLTPEIIKKFNKFKRKSDEAIEDYLNKLAYTCMYYFAGIFGEERFDAVIANLLCFHSPLYFKFEGEVVNGWIQIIFLGDTTTGKSQIARKTSMYLDIGVYVTGETCSRTGFLYAIDTKTFSSPILKWGLLPQQDRSILIIDGANYISADEWGTAREARRSGKLIVERVVKGECPCRTRLILIANPSKALVEYMYPIECSKDLFQEPDIARTDICVCFSDKDVSQDEINMPHSERPKPEMDLDRETMKHSVAWAWSRKPENIIISDETVEVVCESAKVLIEKFSCGDIPLVTNDMKYKLVRISVALATLLHSTDESYENIIVTPEIVYAAQDYITRLYSSHNIKLDLYADDAKSKSELTDEEFEKIEGALLELQQKDRSNILKELLTIFRSNKSIRLNEICAQLDKSQSTIKEKVAFFKKYGLIWSGKSGYMKTGKFIQFLNKLSQKHV